MREGVPDTTSRLATEAGVGLHRDHAAEAHELLDRVSVSNLMVELTLDVDD